MCSLRYGTCTIAACPPKEKHMGRKGPPTVIPQYRKILQQVTSRRNDFGIVFYELYFLCSRVFPSSTISVCACPYLFLYNTLKFFLIFCTPWPVAVFAYGDFQITYCYINLFRYFVENNFYLSSFNRFFLKTKWEVEPCREHA